MAWIGAAWVLVAGLNLEPSTLGRTGLRGAVVHTARQRISIPHDVRMSEETDAGEEPPTAEKSMRDKMVSQLAAGGGRLVAYSMFRDDMVAAFEAADADKQGFLTAPGMSVLMAAIDGKEPTDQEVDEMMRAADLMGTGQIEYEQWTKALWDTIEAEAFGEKKGGGFFGWF
jgi:hypothetical protein